MSVGEILASKGREVITTNADASLEEVCNLLTRHKVGATVVLDPQGKVCGIVSERDIVRHIARHGAKALSDKVSTSMTEKVIHCVDTDSIDVAMQKMTVGRFRHLPVIMKGELRGIISIGDVVKRKIEQAEQDAEDLKHYIAG
jgi:CBS domain-containing protein